MIGLCDRFKCLPSQVLAEDVEVLRWLRVLELGDPQPADDGAGFGDPGGFDFE